MAQRSTTRIGIDVGSVFVHAFVAGPDGGERGFSRPIRGRALDVLAALVREEVVPFAGTGAARIAVTGQGASIIPAGVGTVNEILAAARGARDLFPGVRTVVDIGGQLSKWVLLQPDGAVADFATNGLCAAGAGAFLEQQAGRLLLGVEEFGAVAAAAERGATVAGRCSVFAKSDMIHLQQRGTPTAEIALGVCAALARMFVATVLEGRTLEPPIALIGGGAMNAGLRRALAETTGLGPGAFLVPADPMTVAARGAALLAEANAPADVATLFSDERRPEADPGGERPSLPTLPPRPARAETPCAAAGSGRVEAYLGVDVGSVSTNLVLLTPAHELLAGLYLRTRGAPVAAIAEGLAQLEAAFGERLDVLGVGTTGSGRHLAARLLGADVVRNEITAQMVSTHHYMPEADTVFEIGGQDSKFIRLRRGLLAEFEMNKICAAGTGSFLEEQAEGLGISIFDEFAARACAATAPLDLGSKCTVFIETELRRAASEGARLEDVCAGLAYAVARNYLEKVVAGREIGERVAFQGGTASNAAVVAAFESLLGRRIDIHPHNRVSGAIGAALIAERERARTGRASAFAGLDACAAISPRVFDCKACENRCQVTRFEVRGGKVHFGDVCERYTDRDAAAAAPKARPFGELFAARERLFERALDEAGRGPGAARGEIGLPRASVLLELAPLFAAWLAELGFAPVLSGATTRETVDVGGRGLPGEICLPIKVAAGHVRALLDADPARRVLAPSVVEMPGAGDGLPGCTCFLTQEWPLLVRSRAGERVATPQLGLGEASDYHEACRALAAALGLPLLRVARALRRALRVQREFVERRLELGRDALAADFDRAIVVIGRPYNLHDAFCNLNLARHLERVGLPAIPVDLLPLAGGAEVAPEESVPWRFARQTLAASEHLARDPRLFPIVVSSYGCGVDGFVLKHLEEALGGRPRLLLEFDEHRGEAGLVTRLEALADEIDEHVCRAAPRSASGRTFTAPAVRGRPPRRRFFVPHLEQFSHVYAGILRAAGNDAVILAPPTPRTVAAGEARCSGRECHPFAVVTGQLVELTESGAARAGDALLVPSSISPCLIKQYGDAQRIIQARMGAAVPEVVDIPSSRLGEFVGFDGVLRFYEGLVAVDLLLPLARRVRPYAADPDAPMARLAAAGREIEEALAGMRPIKPVVAAAAEEIWAMAVRGAPGDRPVVGVTGDLYTRFVDAGNAGLFDRLERLGLEVWPSPFYAACSQMSDTHDRRRDLARWKLRDAARRTLAIGLTTALYRAVARALPASAAGLVVEPEPAEFLALAAPFVGPASSWMHVLAIGKIADFLSRGADGAISAAGVNCMIGTAIAGAVPAVRAAFGGAPIATLTYGGAEGPAQRIKLETFAHQVAARALRSRSARR